MPFDISKIKMDPKKEGKAAAKKPKSDVAPLPKAKGTKIDPKKIKGLK